MCSSQEGRNPQQDWSVMKTRKLLSSVTALLILFGSTPAADAKSVLFTTAKFSARQTVKRCAQWWETARQAGWLDRQLPTLDYILWRESRCNAGVINKTLNGDGSWDYGLAQINDKSWCKITKWYPNGYLQSLNVLDYCKDLLDPYTNLRAAKSLFDYSQKTNENGFQPWGL